MRIEPEMPTPGNALRFFDRHASTLKYGLTPLDQQEFDDCLTVLWDLFLNGRK